MSQVALYAEKVDHHPEWFNCYYIVQVILQTHDVNGISEKDLDNIISEHRKKGNISATLDYKHAVLESDVSFICVGTPSDEDGFLNLDYIFNTVSNRRYN